MPIAHHANRRKKVSVSTARVHPGETGASWMMRGILDFLTGNTHEAKILRALFIFKIVPMLNPDGVVYGNNRCSLAGVDLNRQWKKPSRTLHPTIYYAKALIRSEKAQRDVVMYFDLHGHSRKKNIFMYGCDDRRKPRPAVRVFPKLLSWNALGRKYVSFGDCSFHVKKSREGTGRVVVARELGIANSFTLESTFCGASFGPLKGCHFNTAHLVEVGQALMDTLLDYFLPNPTHRETFFRVRTSAARTRPPPPSASAPAASASASAGGRPRPRGAREPRARGRAAPGRARAAARGGARARRQRGRRRAAAAAAERDGGGGGGGGGVLGAELPRTPRSAGDRGGADAAAPGSLDGIAGADAIAELAKVVLADGDLEVDEDSQDSHGSEGDDDSDSDGNARKRGGGGGGAAASRPKPAPSKAKASDGGGGGALATKPARRKSSQAAAGARRRARARRARARTTTRTRAAGRARAAATRTRRTRAAPRPSRRSPLSSSPGPTASAGARSPRVGGGVGGGLVGGGLGGGEGASSASAAASPGERSTTLPAAGAAHRRSRVSTGDADGGGAARTFPRPSDSPASAPGGSDASGAKLDGIWPSSAARPPRSTTR